MRKDRILKAAHMSIPRDQAEWDKAWATIAEMWGDTRCSNPDNGEVWQYMGTYTKSTGRWAHSFRHRDLKNRGRTVSDIDASPDWEPETARAIEPDGATY